jgi:hypothetical protein
MRLRLLATATAAALVTLMVSAPAQANHSWGTYHWARTANPFTLKLDNNLTSAWTSYLSTASSDWNASSVLDTTVMTGSFGSKSSCSPTTGHVEVCNATYGNTGWLGIASISITTGNHISKAYVKLNDTYFNTAQYNTPDWRQMVTCQEVGHTFGLDHQDTNFTNPNLGTCMDYTNVPAGPPNNLHPNQHDYDQLATIYSHLDSFSTPTAVTVPGQATALAESPSTWGSLVEGSSRSGVSVYVRDLGYGNATLTYVTWA